MISVERHNRAVVITFTRPEIRSPLSVAVLDRLYEVLGRLRDEPVPEKVVFTGEGDCFASGADLREIDRIQPAEAADFARYGQGLMSSISEFPAETVAAVNGFCFGGALDLALACKRRIASPAATFAHPGAGLGILTGWGGTQRLPRLIGTGHALEMLFTASPIGAGRALEIGLVDSIADDLLAAALES